MRIFKSKIGKPLDKWLTEEQFRSLKNKRFLYVISSNMDTYKRKSTEELVIKFGQGKGTQPASRLKDYISCYGYTDSKRPWMGCKLHYLFITEKSKKVAAINSMVHKYELKLKQYARKNNLLVDRGDERILIRLSKLMRILDYKQFKKLTDIESKPTYNLRNKKQKYIVEILDHTNKAKKNNHQEPTTFKVKYSDGSLEGTIRYVLLF
mmetsp:Transcript_32231/g.52244  ORF Transcript_32231/g.52244 Transcript_32231/m.52244 type:complete len:208 (-) Transcript_32231:387-1010(-)